MWREPSSRHNDSMESVGMQEVLLLHKPHAMCLHVCVIHGSLEACAAKIEFPDAGTHTRPNGKWKNSAFPRLWTGPSLSLSEIDTHKFSSAKKLNA